MSKTNTLISHHGESSNSRADKMSGMTEACREWSRGKSKKEYKKFFSTGKPDSKTRPRL